MTALKVVQILDRYTLVVAGEGVENITEGADLLVIAIGPKIEGIGRIVVPKARVDVDAHAGTYLIVRAAEEVVDQPSMGGIFGTLWERKRVRRPLPVEDLSMMGNPAMRSIVVGDPVIPVNEFQEFAKQVAAEQSA